MANSNQYEAEVRRKFSDAFDDAVRYVTDDVLKDPLIGGIPLYLKFCTCHTICIYLIIDLFFLLSRTLSPIKSRHKYGTNISTKTIKNDKI